MNAAPEAADKFWKLTSAFHAAPASERAVAFEMLVRCAAGLAGPDFPQAEIVDRLQSTADAVGLNEACGVDVVQELMARGFSNPITDEDDEAVDLGDAADRPPAFSDEALALDFAEQHATHLRYVAAWGRWILWDGTRWQFDKTLRAFDLVRKICRAAAAICGLPKVATAIASAKTVASVERLAKADRRLAATAEQWDVDPWLLNTPDGVVDLRTGKCARHSPRIT